MGSAVGVDFSLRDRLVGHRLRECTAVHLIKELEGSHERRELSLQREASFLECDTTSPHLGVHWVMKLGDMYFSLSRLLSFA